MNAVVVLASTWAVVLGGAAAALAFVLQVQDDAATYWGLIGSVSAVTFMIGVLRVRLEVDDEEIRVFNVIRSYRIQWSAVAGINVVRWWWSPSMLIVGRSAVAVSTTSGARYVIDASTIEVPRVLSVLQRFDPEARRSDT